MKAPITVDATLMQPRCISHRQTHAIVTQALCMGIVPFGFPGAIVGLRNFVIAFWNHHPLAAVAGISAAIMLFSTSLDFGTTGLRADPAQRI